MFAMKRQMHALGSEAERIAKVNLAIKVALEDTVSLACAFAWDVGAGNKLEMTDEEFRECIRIRFAPETQQMREDVKARMTDEEFRESIRIRFAPPAAP
jgi:hypothetical protein